MIVGGYEIRIVIRVIGTAVAAIIPEGLLRANTAADPFHANEAEDMTPIVHTGTFRVGTWPDQDRHVAGKQYNQDESSVMLDFKVCACPQLHTLPRSIVCTWFFLPSL